MNERQVAIRPATPGDGQILFDFICALAEYEDALGAVESTAEALNSQLSTERPPFEALIAELAAEPVGFALFFQNYSTWDRTIGHIS